MAVDLLVFETIQTSASSSKPLIARAIGAEANFPLRSWSRKHFGVVYQP